MHILFVDESGTPPPPGKVTDSYFVIAGIVVPEGVWEQLRRALIQIKREYGIRPDGEIKWRYFAPKNRDESNPLRHLEPVERNEVRTELYAAICRHKAVRTIACVAGIRAAYAIESIQDRADLYEATYKPVSERFQYHLQALSRQLGQREYGIVVSDHRGSDDDKRLRRHHERLLAGNSAFTSDYRNLVESIFFQPSDLSVGIQFADMAAGAVWRRFEREDSTWFDRLEPSFRRSGAGQIAGYGLVKFPKAGWK